MIHRIVRMEFRPDACEDFLKIFRSSMKQIRNFPGCRHLELHRDAGKENVFYTFSIWDAESDLENYRHSDLFKRTWKATKALFDAKPLAYSLKKEIEVSPDQASR